jgi:ATP-dependent Clp endopeptidase proteolytic subunit ClpP
MTGHVFIYGTIGLDRGEISHQNVLSQLQEPDVKSASEIVVHLISPGGLVTEGEAIYNALKNTKKKITTQIEGTCASIATLIAAAGEKIIMNKTARFMIHNPQISGLSGDSRQLRHVATQLDQIKTLLINVYDQKTSLGKEKLWELYDNETWLTAEQAEQMGFVDESVDAIKAVAKVNLNQITMESKDTWLVKAFKNMLGLSKIKNQFEETLADGRKIYVMSDDENWTGKQVVSETGEPIEPGEHALASGKILVVGDGSVITEVKEGAAPQDKQQNEEMDNKIAELEKQLAEAKAAKDTAVAEAEAAKAEAIANKNSVSKIENRMQALEKKYLNLAEEAGKTVGDNTPPGKGPVIKAVDDTNDKHDPMGDEAVKFFRNRNLISNEQD